MTQPTPTGARASLAALIGYEPDEHDAEFEKALAAYRAAVLDEAADAVAAYTGNPIDANAQMLRRKAEEARS